MRKTCYIRLSIGITIVFISLQSCSLSIFRTAPDYDVSDVLIEERRNGYLLRIVAHRQISQFEAWVNREEWLYITIAEATVNLENLELLRPSGLIELIEVTPFEGSVQIAMKLSRTIRYCDVIRDKKSNDILVALHFDWEKDPGN